MVKGRLRREIIKLLNIITREQKGRYVTTTGDAKLGAHLEIVFCDCIYLHTCQYNFLFDKINIMSLVRHGCNSTSSEQSSII